MDVKYILKARIVEEIVEGKPKSIFPLTLSSERPDTAASALFEGRVIVLVDGTPQVMIAPTLFAELFQAPDDYYVSFGRFPGPFIEKLYIGIIPRHFRRRW